MTIMVGIRTGSDVVFATDSKLTTQGLSGRDENGNARLSTQTYEMGTKIVFSARGGLACALAGSIGPGISPLDHFGSLELFPAEVFSPEAQYDEIRNACESLAKKRADFLATIFDKEEDWPSTTVLLSAAHPENFCPRVWRLSLKGAAPRLQEVLTEPGILTEGSPQNVDTLLYGTGWGVLEVLRDKCGLTDDQIINAVFKGPILLPKDRINLYAIPLKDAVDLAYFLANVQVQMDRFLAGQEACGGPIDIAVVHGRPRQQVSFLPGKDLRHPGVQALPIRSDSRGRMP